MLFKSSRSCSDFLRNSIFIFCWICQLFPGYFERALKLHLKDEIFKGLSKFLSGRQTKIWNFCILHGWFPELFKILSELSTRIQFCKEINPVIFEWFAHDMGVARIFSGRDTFRKFSKKFLRKLRKMHYLFIFSKNLTNHALIFSHVWTKNAICWEVFGKFWKCLMKIV